MRQDPVRLCEVCWKDNIAARAVLYLSTIPVCLEHQDRVCNRCQRRWSAWYFLEMDGSCIFTCDHCRYEIERLAARREAYNKHLASKEWRQTKKLVRSQSIHERGDVACSRCGMSERQNRLEYGEGLHGHHVTYERFGYERPEDVVLLCSLCHAWEHGLPPPKSIKV